MKTDDVPPDVPPASLNPEKDPDDWVTKDEPMTGPQRSYLQTLCREAAEEFNENWTKAEASKKIDELQQKTGRGKTRPTPPIPSGRRDAGNCGVHRPIASFPSTMPAIYRKRACPVLTRVCCTMRDAAARFNRHILRDGHLAANAKRAARDFQSGRSLFALVFIQIDTALHPAHCFLIKTARDDVARAEVFLHIKLQDFIENFVRRKCVLIFLVWL